MIVDPAMIVKYAVPILILTVAVILGQSLFGTFGVLLSGQSLKTSIQCGFSLTQIGEFAFIIASLGISLKVMDGFLYPIVVAVSVITTFTTPYMIKASEPASAWIDKKIPDSWTRFLVGYSSGLAPANKESMWHKLITALFRIIIIYSIVSVAIILISFHFINPFFLLFLPFFWGRVVSTICTIVLVSPFLRAIMMKKNHSIEFETLWNDNSYNHGILVSTIFLRIMLSALFVIYIISHYFRASIGLSMGIALIAVLIMMLSRPLKRRSILIERVFVRNF